MTEKEKLKALLRDMLGKGVNVVAEYLIANGVRVEATPERYDYGNCPFRDKRGDGCTILANMLCKDPQRNLPCGFYPEEQRRRAVLMDATGENCFRPLAK